MTRQKWGSRLGIILAVAGSAVGLGNFLRFPVQAAQNGGGAFMIPYLISLFFLGIPLMWVEWAIGRYGGLFGHGSAPGAFHSLWKNRFIKYLGVIGIFGPLVIFIYYTYIESWLLGYAFFSLTGKLFSLNTQASMQNFLQSYQGLTSDKTLFFWSYFFFLVTFSINFVILYRGIKGGIEALCKIAMPLLFAFAIIVAVRVLTFGAPDHTKPTWSVINGLGFLWNPDFSVLSNSQVWLAAAGQIFFTLSVGMGAILTYASYLSKGDDVVLSGLTASSTNELAEVVIGGSIVIPAAFAFFGPLAMGAIAQGGAFNLGFVTMPLIFNKISFGIFFAFLWFMLLFLAGLTSSVSLMQPAVAFIEDEFKLSTKKTTVILGIVSFILCQLPIFFLGYGVLDELDFWAGTVAITVFALAESIIFVWIFGINRAWEEIHHGAELRIPEFYKFILKYITPTFLIFILGFWFFQKFLPIILMEGVKSENIPYVLGTRIGLVLLFLVIAVLVKVAWQRKKVAD